MDFPDDFRYDESYVDLYADRCDSNTGTFKVRLFQRCPASEEGLINLVSFLDNIKFEQWAINSRRPGIALQGTWEGEPRYALDLAVHLTI